MVGPAPLPGKPPQQKNLSRRVSFNEATISKPQHEPTIPNPQNAPPNTYHTSYTVDVEANDGNAPRGRCGSVCNSCCAWTSMIICFLILLFILIGGAYFSFLQSNLPEVHLHRLDINDLYVNTTNEGMFLTADLEVFLNVTNKNDKIALSYSPMNATIFSEGINLGSVNVPALFQNSQASSELQLPTAVNSLPVPQTGGQDMADKAQVHSMVIDVVVRGHVEFSIDGHKMNRFPFRLSCLNIYQSEIDNGLAPRCSSRLIPFL